MYKRTMTLLLLALALALPVGALAETPEVQLISAPVDASGADGTLYVVQAGDWLSTIAADLLGDMTLYPSIVEATNARAASEGDTDAIADPDLIFVGQRLWVPAMAQTVPSGSSNALWDLLLTASLDSEWVTEPAVLADGRFSVAAAPGSASTIDIMLIDAAYTDLDGDGDEDAAAVVATDPGGSGTFYTLEAFLYEDGKLTHAATQLLGDRIRLQGLLADSGRVTVSMLVAGPGDPSCCPTTPGSMSLTLSDGAWVVE